MTANLQLTAHRLGCILWRNNSGAACDASGRPVRYGLGNVSKAVCAVFKSSDYVGMTPSGKLLAIEEKPLGWVYRGTPREVAQLNFINEVKRRGGRAGFATCAEDVISILLTP
jgi:hypothetical protein